MLDLLQGLIELVELVANAAVKFAIVYIILKCAAWASVNLPPLSVLVN
jgi:hypothetical protein